jgi:hypothetical protein
MYKVFFLSNGVTSEVVTPTIIATHNIRSNLMIDSDKEINEYQSQYLDLLNRLTQLYLAGEEPTDELRKQAQKIGQAAQIPDFLLR